MLKVLHTGDWHIGNFPGPEINGENARFLDIRNCLDAQAEAAEQHRPDIIIVSGDIFHQARVWSDRGLKESRTAIDHIRRLANVAPTVVVRGTPNHDSAEQFEMLKTAFTGDDCVHIITEPTLLKVHTYSGQQVQVAGVPGFDRGYYRAQHPGLSREEETQVFTDALESIVMGLKAQCEPGIPAILSTHFTVPGCNMESGQTALFAQYEPVIYPATLAAAGFDLVALGHIHRPQKLPEAGNAFYCGSLMGTNFNDEGQERGFYIHTLDGSPAPAIASEYITTPYRRLETIRLTQTDIDGINAGAIDEVAYNYWGYRTDPEASMAGSIVRVLYSCSDKANKAFNKALLEKRLYDDGAFWVSEITPEEISTSVNREELTGDNSPEENLAAYLGDKGMAPEDAARIIELARPIISETIEKTRIEAPTGVFLPLEISVHNYRNYRDETFSYEGINFATINGENGAGKSSLFMDAMLDALYEEPREGDLTGWICNAPDARSGSIKFTFRLGEKTYRVTRTRQKSGKATLNIAELVEGEWQDRSAERYRDTQAIIEHTIGMDSLTLKATGLIMQDQYGLFLQADKTDRMSILGSILGLGIYSGMEDAAADKATAANRELRRIGDAQQEIARSMPDRAAVEKDLADAAEGRETVLRRLERKKEIAENTRFKLRVASEAAIRAEKIIAEITSLEGKRNACAAAQDAQRAAISAAQAIIEQADSIAAGVAGYRALQDREKAMLGDIALYDAKTAEAARIDAQLADARRKKMRLEADKSAAATSCWGYEQALAGADALEAQVARYADEAERLAQLEQQDFEYLDLGSKRSSLLTEIRTASAKLEGEKKAGGALVETLRARAAMLENSGCTASNPSCEFLRDAIEARDRIPSEEAKLAAYVDEQAAAIDAMQAQADELAEQAAKLYCAPALSAQRAAVRDLQKAKDELAELAIQRVHLDALKARMETITANIAELDDTITSLEAQKAPVAAELARIETVRKEYAEITASLATEKIWLEREKQLPTAIERQTIAEARLAELTAEEADLGTQIAAKEAERDKESADATGLARLDAELKLAEADINEGETVLRSLDESTGRYRRQMDEIEKAEARLAELRNQAETQGQLAADYEELKRAFSQDGIPHNIVRTIVPLFEATATNILGQMSAGHMSVEFRMEKTLKSNSKKEVTALDIIINDASTGALPYMSRSGGERVKAALSVILALSEIKSSTAGVQLGFLFIDEPPFLDDKGVQAYCDALEAIQRRYPGLKIMAITHDPEMKARFPQSVDVVKTEEGSKVIYA